MIADRIIAWSLAFALAFFPALSLVREAQALSPQQRLIVLHQQPAASSGGACSGWTPATPSGLVAWYKADVGVTDTGDGTAATAWADQSGAGNNVATLVGTTSPTYRATGLGGKQAIQWSASTVTSMVTAPTDTMTNMGTGNVSSAFVLGSLTTSASANGLGYSASGQSVGAGANSGTWFYFSTTPDFTWDHAFGTGTPQAVTANAEIRMGMIFDGANATPYLNGVAGTPNALNFNWASPGTLQISAGFNGWDGFTREIILYKTALGSTDRSCMDAYLVSRQ